MQTQKYSVSDHPVGVILSWVSAGEIAIPEIQRPFVWDSTDVRDLIDSLYKGYPIGYLIVWHDSDVKLKDGTTSIGKKILIDGQQRITSFATAILGQSITNKDYKRTKITIAFNPLKEQFEVLNPAIQKDKSWLPDISQILSKEIDLIDLIETYCSQNENTNRNDIYKKVEALKSIIHKPVGLIELAHDLDIETVTEIFIRINAKGVVLSQADFVMSKIAANEKYGGATLRKCIDYFCHLAVAPEFYPHLAEVDQAFTATPFFQKISWLKNENDDLYDPGYQDLLRVAFIAEFERGKLGDLVSLLSGRDFETRSYKEEIMAQSFAKLESGIVNFINETNFKRFVMIIKSAGFIDPQLIRSQNALNFAYVVYLKLKAFGYNSADIEQYVRRWFVLSILKGRYSSSPESQFDFDIRNMANRKFQDYLANVEQAELSDAFWQVALVQNLETSVASSPNFNVFLAAQVKGNDKGFLSKDILVKDLIAHKGDIHHIFPREYLKKFGLKRGTYNQIANYVYMQSEINIKIGKKAPDVYFKDLQDQCQGGELKYGGIRDTDTLRENLNMNCVPETIFSMNVEHYEDFLALRRKLMAEKIREYYFSL
jgi:hypothetical protein